VVLDNYPVESIQNINISSVFFTVALWPKLLIEGEGEMVNQNDIKHRILRPVWNNLSLRDILNFAPSAARDCSRKLF